MVTIPVKEIKSIGAWFLKSRINGVITSDPHALESDIIKNIFNKTKNQIKEVCTNIVRKKLKDHPTYHRIWNGSLDRDFGFVHGSSQNRINNIVTGIVENSSIELFRQVNLIRVSYIVNTEALFDLEDAIVRNDSGNPGAAETLEWLQWILYMGGKIIVAEHHIVYGNFGNPPSRSEEAIMKPGGYWAVPSDVQGVPKDNWITQSMREAEKTISPSIKQILTREMNLLYG